LSDIKLKFAQTKKPTFLKSAQTFRVKIEELKFTAGLGCGTGP